jgi:hypothetical protein
MALIRPEVHREDFLSETYCLLKEKEIRPFEEYAIQDSILGLNIKRI